ncbi:MAG: hypothetical protein GEU93_04230 [Propionibacteriales bacterium]|nr:hypothetical protein [Propionibacteriales bacterium]
MADRKAIFADGWERACRLYALLSEGGAIPTAGPTTVRLEPDEQVLVETELGFERRVGKNVTIPVRPQRKHGIGMLGIGPTAIIRAMHNRQVRAEHKAWARWADEQATPQWQHLGSTRTVMTDRRILCDYRGWVVFWFSGVVELRPAPESWWFELYFNDTAPLRLVGAFAPWCSVALASLLYGPQGLALPGFEALHHAPGGPLPKPPKLPK